MTNITLTMKLLEGKYGVSRLTKDTEVPIWAFDSEFYSITKTDDELSIVCLENIIPSNIKFEKDWRVLKVIGPLDFSLVGILSKISTLLAEQNISIFAISTYDTDYILVKTKDLNKTLITLGNNNYKVI